MSNTIQLDSSDAMMDISAELVRNPDRRDSAMQRAHDAGLHACEICGKGLKLGSEVVVSFRNNDASTWVGPECVKRMRKLGFCG